MALCKECRSEVSWLRLNPGGLCDSCAHSVPRTETPEGQPPKARMPVCRHCGRTADASELTTGLCAACLADYQRAGGGVVESQISARPKLQPSAIVLTTESAPSLPIDRRLDIVTAEVVIGLHIFKDIASVWRDTFGGRSKVMQDGLRDARKTALDELRREAAALGADAVVAVDLDYSEISGGGKSMLFLVASGTAVTLRGGA